MHQTTDMRAGDDSVQPCSKSFFFTALSCLVQYTKGDVVVDCLFKVHLEPKHNSLSVPHPLLPC